MVELLQAVLLLTLRLTLPAEAGKATANTVASHEAETEDPADTPGNEAAEAYAERAFEKALPAAERAVEQAWKEFGGEDYRTIAAEEFLAHLAALNKDPGRAQAIREETDRKLAQMGNPALVEKVRITRAEEYHDTAPSPEKGN